MKSSIFILLVITLTISSVTAFKRLRSNQIVGGYKTVDLAHQPEDFQQARYFALNHYAEMCQGNDVSSQVKLGGALAASSQVVAGTNYKITFAAKNYKQNRITIVVFSSLPDKLKKRHYSITSCQ